MEYTRFGTGFMRRADASAEWAACAQDDVPADFFEEEARIKVRVETGRDPWYTPSEGEVLGTGRAGGVRLPNALVDPVAEELGLPGDRFRREVNTDTPTNTRRIDEARFDQLARDIDMDPEELRTRFRGGSGA